MTTNTRTLEFTSYIMAVSYGVENAWIKYKLTPEKIDYSNSDSEGMQLINREIIREIEQLEKRLQKQLGKDITIPPIPSDQLQYLHSYHDKVTGMTGVAFLDVANQEIIIGYVGTNPSNDGWRDLVLADFVGIGLSGGVHYPAALQFYKDVQEKFPNYKIGTLTGHSLGGNEAQWVALATNTPKTVVYNAAPLYLPFTTSSNLLSQANKRLIEELALKFDGDVIRIRAKDDALNAAMNLAEGRYIGREYVLDASGEHGQEHFLTEKNQKYIRQIISGDNITGIFPKNNNPALATEYVAEKVFDLSEAIVDKVIDTEAVLRTKAKFTLIEKLIELIPGNQTDKAKEVLKVRMALEVDKTNLKKDIGSLKNSILEFISNQGNDNDNQLEGDLFHVIAVNDVIDGKGGNDTIKGRKGQDVLSGGDGDDTLDGGDGDDWLYGDNGRDVLTGGDGNDVLDGGKGLDNLYGEKGDDVYIFEKGDGQDTIFDSQGWNIVYLKDIPSSEVEGTFDQFGAPAIRVKGTDQTIGFYQFNSGDKQRQQFVLAYSDNKKVLLRSGYDSPFRNLVGTDGNDKYSAFLKRTTIHGRAGDDELTGSSGTDTLYGEEGKDTLNGREGNDTLIGGTGNDELYGGEGDDVYVFGTHFGSDWTNVK